VNGGIDGLSIAGVRHVIKNADALAIGGCNCPMCPARRVRPDSLHVLTECKEGAAIETLEQLHIEVGRLADLVSPGPGEAWWGALLEDLLSCLRVLNGKFLDTQNVACVVARHQASSILSGMLAEPHELLLKRCRDRQTAAINGAMLEMREAQYKGSEKTMRTKARSMLRSAARRRAQGGARLSAQEMALSTLRSRR